MILFNAHCAVSIKDLYTHLIDGDAVKETAVITFIEVFVYIISVSIIALIFKALYYTVFVIKEFH